MSTPQEKVTPEHLARRAFLYVRQSTLRQVMENTESTDRQYALRRRAIALGWSEDGVEVIDSDLGQSGASAADREGFQRLVTEVGMGRAGIVMGLEVSRLARNSSDWHRLLDIAALTGTLILDEDGLYDPSQFNDRLLLGLKGTMSEAELHMIRSRLRGGMLNKARRGELALRLPIGFEYDPVGKVVLTPDQQVRDSIRLLFRTFERVGSAHATLRHFRDQGLRFPFRAHSGPRKGETIWRALAQSRVAEMLRNPRYAGAYAYGRRQARPSGIDGRIKVWHLPRERWHVLIPNAHEGYISWNEYEDHLRRIEANALGPREGWKCPPREGPSLLQGLLLCGKCGTRMSVRYHVRRKRLTPEYTCVGAGCRDGRPRCQSMPGGAVDDAIADLLFEVVTPLTLEVALAVQEELKARIDEADALRRQQVERARYEADVARQRYMQVDPQNRLVAGTLEADWNEKLRLLTKSHEEYERARQADRLELSDEKRARVLALAQDFPRVWRDPKTPFRERKRMAGLLVEDVTLVKEDGIAVHVRFRGGATRSLHLSRPLTSWEERKTAAAIIEQIDRLLEDRTYGEVADFLNEQGHRTGCGNRYHRGRIKVIARAYGLRNLYTRLREAGWIDLDEVAAKLGVCKATVKRRRAMGKLGLASRRANDTGEYLYEDPERQQGMKGGPVPPRSEEV